MPPKNASVTGFVLWQLNRNIPDADAGIRVEVVMLRTILKVKVMEALFLLFDMIKYFSLRTDQTSNRVYPFHSCRRANTSQRKISLRD